MQNQINKNTDNKPKPISNESSSDTGKLARLFLLFVSVSFF